MSRASSRERGRERESIVRILNSGSAEVAEAAGEERERGTCTGKKVREGERGR